MNPVALLAYLFFYKIHFGVRCTKVFDTFGNSLILLNVNFIMGLMNITLQLYDLPYQGNPFIRQFIIFFIYLM